VYRVITKYRNGTARPIVEHGPWHATRDTAEYWAEILNQRGYQTEIESQRGPEQGDNSNADLAAALAGMA
jgi:hypothetical protein